MDARVCGQPVGDREAPTAPVMGHESVKFNGHHGSSSQSGRLSAPRPPLSVRSQARHHRFWADQFS